MNTEDGARKALHAYVRPDSHLAWHKACAAEGVSVAALLDVLGSRIENLLRSDDGLVKEARRLDANRRRRSGH
ncbi:MAG: hypothetical protein GY750_13175 [Lentisphaerae bacterium]|nr:hypothetical protein [Lentisphaerota bacterium]